MPNTASIFAKKTYLSDGWADNVRLHIADDRITNIETNSSVHSEDFFAEIVLPGIANAHSHAFQRALAGHCEKRSPSHQDNFWSWREQMYRLAGLIDADQLTSVARQLYSEMLESGYTSVAEFHYLHGDPIEGTFQNEMYRAIVQAATDSGIRLIYIPILYESAGFGQSKTRQEQYRFAVALEQFVEHYRQARATATEAVSVGIGAHSLRAVTRDSLKKISEVSHEDNCPFHIHISEQVAEVEQCIATHGSRPVEWLLNEFHVGPQWCLVHATHVNESELDEMSDAGVVVCLCPTTEANLGDGIFPLASWFKREGRIAIGSDSHVSINPFEELRWLEYGQRLASMTRNVATINDDHTGRKLLNAAWEGGSLACGHESGTLEVGSYADLITLDAEHAMLAGHDNDSLLDALVFTGCRLPIDRVMVAGTWQVYEGIHRDSQSTRRDYNRTVQELWAVA